MRRVAVAVMMLGTMSGAHAADMPDFLRGSLSDGYVAPAPVNWSGFYLGGQAGYGSSDSNFSGSNGSMISALIDHNVIQQMDVANWNLLLGKTSERSPG